MSKPPAKAGAPTVPVPSDPPRAAAPGAFKATTGSMNNSWSVDLLNRTLGTTAETRAKNQTADEKRAAEVKLTADTIAAFEPKDAIEGMIAAQAVALHHASLECLRKAMIAEQPSEFASRLRRDGANMARGFTDMLDALSRHRGKGPQVVRVERVVVQDGGQAVVGNVTAGAPLPRVCAAPLALEQATSPMTVMEAERVEAGRGRG